MKRKNNGFSLDVSIKLIHTETVCPLISTLFPKIYQQMSAYSDINGPNGKTLNTYIKLLCKCNVSVN